MVNLFDYFFRGFFFLFNLITSLFCFIFSFLILFSISFFFESKRFINPLQPRQPYLEPNFEFRYFKNYNKLINCVFCKMLIRLSSFQKKYSGQKIKGTHFFGVLVGCLKINRNSDKRIFFQKMSIFIFSIKLCKLSPNKITSTC